MDLCVVSIICLVIASVIRPNGKHLMPLEITTKQPTLGSTQRMRSAYGLVGEVRFEILEAGVEWGHCEVALQNFAQQLEIALSLFNKLALTIYQTLSTHGARRFWRLLLTRLVVGWLLVGCESKSAVRLDPLVGTVCLLDRRLLFQDLYHNVFEHTKVSFTVTVTQLTNSPERLGSWKLEHFNITELSFVNNKLELIKTV